MQNMKFVFEKIKEYRFKLSINFFYFLNLFFLQQLNTWDT